MSDERAGPAGAQGGGAAADQPTYHPDDAARQRATVDAARRRLQELGVAVPSAPTRPALSEMPAPESTDMRVAVSTAVQAQVQAAIEAPGAPDDWFGKLVDELADTAVTLGISHGGFLEKVQQKAEEAGALEATIEAMERIFVDELSDAMNAERMAMFFPSFPGQDGTVHASFAALQRNSRTRLSVEPSQEELAIKAQRQAEEDEFLWGDDSDDDGTGEGILPMTDIVRRHQHKFVETIRALLRPTVPHLDEYLDNPQVQPVAGESNRSGGVATQITQGREYHRQSNSVIMDGSTVKHCLMYLAIACVKQAHQAHRQQNYLSALKTATFLGHFKRDLTEEEQSERDDEATKISFEDDVLAVLEVEVASRTDNQKELIEGYDWIRSKRWPIEAKLNKGRPKEVRKLRALEQYKNEKGDDLYSTVRSISRNCLRTHLRGQEEIARAFTIKDDDFSVHVE